jgi:hypothetical protein
VGDCGVVSEGREDRRGELAVAETMQTNAIIRNARNIVRFMVKEVLFAVMKEVFFV